MAVTKRYECKTLQEEELYNLVRQYIRGTRCKTWWRSYCCILFKGFERLLKLCIGVSSLFLSCTLCCSFPQFGLRPWQAQWLLHGIWTQPRLPTCLCSLIMNVCCSIEFCFGIKIIWHKNPYRMLRKSHTDCRCNILPCNFRHMKAQ